MSDIFIQTDRGEYRLALDLIEELETVCMQIGLF